MARPDKQGLDYFPMDVDLDMDDKLSMVIGEFGSKGELIYIKLLGWIYKHKGFYTEWNERELLKFAKRVSYIGGSSVNLITEVTNACIKWGLFDEPVFNTCGVLTSSRIQKTWLEASKKRKSKLIPPEMVVIDAKTGKKLGFPPEETTQSKVKEIKEKESKDDGAAETIELPSVDDYAEGLLEEEPEKPDVLLPGVFVPPTPIPSGAQMPTLDEVKFFFVNSGSNNTLAETFFNNQEGKGWRIGMTPIFNWRAVAKNWLATEAQKTKQAGQPETATERFKRLSNGS